MSSSSVRMTTSSFYLVIIAIVPVFFLPAAFDVFNTPKAWILGALCLALVAHFLLTAGGSFRQSSIDKTFSLNRIAISCTWILMAGILTSSILSDTTLGRVVWGFPGRANGLIYFFSTLSLLLIANRMQIKENFSSRLILAIQFPILINCFYGLIQFLGLDPIPWTNPYNPIIGTFGNPNFSAAFLAIGAVINIWLSISSNSSLFRFTYSLIAIVSAFLSFLTNSLQGPLILGLGLGLILLRLIFFKLARRKFYAVLFFSSLALLYLFLSLLGLGPYGSRFGQYTLVLRLEYWKIGWKTAWDNPLVGVGTDSYVEGFRQFRSVEFVEKYSQDLTADSAHSVPFNFLANFGFLNFILILILITAISATAVKLLFNRKSHPILTLLSLTWILLLIQSQFSLEQIGLGLFQWAIGGLVLSQSARNFWLKSSNTNTNSSKFSRSPANRRGFKQEFAGEIALVLFVTALFVFSPIIKDDLFLAKLRSGSAQQQLDKVDLENRINSVSKFTKQEVRRAIYLSDYYTNQKNIAKSEELLVDILDQDPQAYEALNLLARIANFESKYEKEIELRVRIGEIDPRNQENLLLLASAYKLNNQTNKAISTVESMLSTWPDSPQADSASALLSELKK